MAFDGITVHALTYELKNILSGGRINKIAQTEKDELILKRIHRPEQTAHMCQSKSAACIYNIIKQTGSPYGTRFLYALKKAYQ